MLRVNSRGGQGVVGAREGSRTPDLRITSALLYQLSYPGGTRHDSSAAPAPPNLLFSLVTRQRTFVVSVPGVTFTLLPAVDVAGGRVFRLGHGGAGTEAADGDPRDAALAWQAGGAEWVHLVDLDAASRGSPSAASVPAPP